MTSTLAYAVSYLGAGLASLAITPLTMRLARRMGIVDLPNARKVHRAPMPRTGGLAIASAMFLTLVPVLLLTGSFQRPGVAVPHQVLALLGAGLFLLLVGLADDIYHLSSKYKLVALLVGSLVFCASGMRIHTLGVGSLSVDLGMLSVPVTLLWIIGVTVSINFIDGLDGLAAGITGIASGVLAVGAIATGHVVTGIFALTLLGSLTGFLIFNFNPAKVFMGDCGSMFIGFTLAACSVQCTSKVGPTVGLFLPGLALSIPLLDTLFTFVRRGILQRRSIFSAERGHIHHRLLDMGLGHRHAVLLLYAISLVAAGVGCVALFDHQGWTAGGGLLLLALLVGGLFRAAGSVRGRETVAAIRRNRAIRRESGRYQRAFEDMQLRLRIARTFDAWWREVCAAAELLDFVALSLPLTNRDGTPRHLHWRRVESQFDDCKALKAELPIPDRRSTGQVAAEVSAPVLTTLESAGNRIALFARLMSEYGLAELPVAGLGAAAPEAAPVGLDAGPASRDLPDAGPVPPADVLALTELIGAREAAGESSEPVAPPTGRPRVAIVHDFLYTYGGAERVLEQILEVYPDADLFSLFDFVPPAQRGFLKNKPVTTTFLQKMPLARKRHRLYLPLMPLAIEQLDVSNYDIVISSSYVAAKGVLTRPGQLHICYCHTPVRFAWDMQTQYLGQGGVVKGAKSILARLILHYIRNWDAQSSSRVDVFVTNSDFVGQRVAKAYRRRSVTIYPPVDTTQFSPAGAKEDFYFTASRLVPYKRIDLIVEAFNRMPEKKLIVVGDGPELQKLKAMAGPNVRVLGHQPFEGLRRYMQFAKAFVFAAEEDFGITPVEAQACGTPVIAFGRGGVTESVVAGRTGFFFAEQTVESLTEAVVAFEDASRASRVGPEQARRNAERFSCQRFRREIRQLVEQEWERFGSRLAAKRATTVAPQADYAQQDAPAVDPLDDDETSVAGMSFQ